MAGIWRKNILSELMWSGTSHLRNASLSDHVTVLACPTPYIAPSWSWASYNGLVEYFPYGGIPEVKIENISAEKDEQNPFGQVLGGTLTLAGKVLPLLTGFYIGQHHIKESPSNFPVRSVDGSSVAITDPDWTFNFEDEAYKSCRLCCSVVWKGRGRYKGSP